MKYQINIYRQKDPSSRGEFRMYEFESEDKQETAAGAITELNKKYPMDPIRWEHSCHQKKCGACAMVINGKPMLACAAVLEEVAVKGKITLEPLRKFPVIADLMVDRSILFENLKTMKLWADQAVEINEKNVQDIYEASRCLQCGCCLEVCPNYYPGGKFFGSAAFAPAAGLIAELSGKDRECIRKEYKIHVYSGCGKSLACHNICPANIDLDRLLSRSNAISIWRKHSK